MKASHIIAIILTVLLLTGVALVALRGTKITQNPPDTKGNTAGNLINLGLFCEDDGKVYFSNPYDNGYLYSMNPDNTEMKHLWDVPVKYINAAGKYLYYYQDGASASNSFGFLGSMLGVYRIKKTGLQNKCLNKAPSGILSLYGNTLYYQHYDHINAMTLYQVTTSGKEKKQLLDSIVSPACIADNTIYFHNTDRNFCLSAYRLDSGSISTVYDQKVYQPILAGRYIYYINVSDHYSLHRYHLDSKEDEKLTDDGVDLFNLSETDNYIYYQKNDALAPELKRIHLDGSNPESVASGNYEQINITSTYTYFNRFDEPVPLYKTATSGDIQVTEFVEAAEAAFLQHQSDK
ncbi:MAG: DUF5050 domain-containing protein [Clostridia bacterium]|nr:DUF5050 domain-containing protein [Clostridia bacterium]